MGRGVIEEAQNDQITFLAASIAYYAFVSIIPLLLFLFLVASIVGGQELGNQAVDQAGEYLAPAGQDAINDAITGEEGRGGATIAGFVVLLWSALKLFQGLDTAFLIVYDAALLKTMDSVGMTPEAFEKTKPRREIWQSHSSTSCRMYDG
jgi:uncharacterized BrkB/YihY/UPF0761 family membrane protein